MDDPFGIGAAKYTAERAWWTGTVDASVTPDAGTDGKLTWQANAPSTPNEESTYTSGQTFEVGFSASKEGGGVSGSYAVNNEKEQTVPDWGVVSDTTGNALSWEFSARNSCDIRADSYSSTRCFNTGTGADGTPVRPNTLSLGNLPLAASARWRTKQLLKPGDGKSPSSSIRRSPWPIPPARCGTSSAARQRTRVATTYSGSAPVLPPGRSRSMPPT